MKPNLTTDQVKQFTSFRVVYKTDFVSINEDSFETLSDAEHYLNYCCGDDTDELCIIAQDDDGNCCYVQVESDEWEYCG